VLRSVAVIALRRSTRVRRAHDEDGGVESLATRLFVAHEEGLHFAAEGLLLGRCAKQRDPRSHVRDDGVVVKRLVGDAVDKALAIGRKRLEEAVEDEQNAAEVLVDRVVVGRVMDAVKNRRVEDAARAEREARPRVEAEEQHGVRGAHRGVGHGVDARERDERVKEHGRDRCENSTRNETDQL
jgi:hypothetical protein